MKFNGTKTGNTPRAKIVIARHGLEHVFLFLNLRFEIPHVHCKGAESYLWDNAEDDEKGNKGRNN
jgi:hypothetical protein